MKIATLSLQKNKLLKEVFLLRAFCAFLMVLVFLLGLSTFYQIGRERILILPPIIKNGFWIASDTAEDKYLIEMAEFWGGLLLTANESNFNFRRKHLLEHVDSRYYTPVKKTIIEQEHRIKRGITSSFSPKSFKVDNKKLLVELEGILQIYEGGREVKTQEAKFKIGFTMRESRIFVKSFEEIIK